MQLHISDPTEESLSLSLRVIPDDGLSLKLYTSLHPVGHVAPFTPKGVVEGKAPGFVVAAEADYL